MRTTNIDTLSIYYTSQTQFAHHRMGLVIPADSCLTNQDCYCHSDETGDAILER